MPAVDVVDQSWVGVRPTRLAPALAETARWRRWWPDLDLQVAEWRGPKGMRWTVRTTADGRFRGSMEVWLQPVFDGAVAHYFLRLDPVEPAGLPTERESQRLVERHRLRAKRVMWELADTLDPDRLARLAGPVRPESTG